MTQKKASSHYPARFWPALIIFSMVGQVLIPGIIGSAIGEMVLRNAETILNDDGTTSFIPNANIFLAALAAAVVLIAVLMLQFRMMRKEKTRV